MKGRAWTDPELDTLCLNYWLHGTPGTARMLRRTRGSCKWMAQKLGLRTRVRARPTKQVRMARQLRTLVPVWSVGVRV